MSVLLRGSVSQAFTKGTCFCSLFFQTRTRGHLITQCNSIPMRLIYQGQVTCNHTFTPLHRPQHKKKKNPHHQATVSTTPPPTAAPLTVVAMVRAHPLPRPGGRQDLGGLECLRGGTAAGLQSKQDTGGWRDGGRGMEGWECRVSGPLRAAREKRKACKAGRFRAHANSGPPWDSAYWMRLWSDKGGSQNKFTQSTNKLDFLKLNVK